MGRTPVGDAAVEPSVDASVDPPLAKSPPRRAWDAARSRPILTVTLLGIVAAALNIWWVASHRDLGAFTVDEVGYMATGLGYHRMLDPAHPMDVVRAVYGPSPTGPLVPVLSVPVLVLGSRSVTTAMATQAVIVVVAAIAAAGCARRLAGRTAALCSGVVVLTLPAMVNSARIYQFAAALGACMLLALWALLASDRGHRRWAMVAFGAAVGSMLLARTMALGFVPGMILAATIVVRRDRRGLTNAALAAGAAAAVAGPWWYVSREPLYDYLFRYGYGDQATEYGGTDIAGRAVSRFLSVVGDIRPPYLLLGAVALGVVLLSAVRLIRSGDGLRRWPLADRGLAASLAVVTAGALALMSTANLGVWFELPLVLVAVVVLVSATSLVGGRSLRILGSLALAVAVVTVGVSLADRGGEYDLGTPRGFARAMFHGGLDERQPDVGAAEPRLRSNDRSTRAAAAAEWWDPVQEVAARLDELRADTPGLVVTLSGSSQLFNGQSLRLAPELSSRPPVGAEELDTHAPDAELLSRLEPYTREGSRRVLVLLFPESELFPMDRRVDHVAALAADAGWRTRHTTTMPDGGHAEILDHPAHAG